MSAPTLSPKFYSEFTHEERLRLLLAAGAREDEAEIVRLWQGCPRMELVGPDPTFARTVLRMRDAICALVRVWIEVSYDILVARLAGAIAEADDGVGLAATAEARWKQASAASRGIEAGITSFCEDVNVTLEQLLALGDGLPRVVEETRGMLAPGPRADRRLKHATLSRLWRAWLDGDEAKIAKQFPRRASAREEGENEEGS